MGTKCLPPYTKVGGMCLAVVKNQMLSFEDARQYCQKLGHQLGNSDFADLLTTPDCEDFTLLSRYLIINGNLY